MARLKTYEEFVTENIGAALGSPIKYTKIKNNLKKYQKSLVQKALNDLDYQKKKEKAGELTSDQKEKLKLAKDAKNQAVGDIVDLTSQRIDDLATTDKLKKVASLGKTKSKLAANKVVLKSADGDMKAALKKKEAKLQAKATKLTQDVKADVKEAPKEADKVKKADPIKKADPVEPAEPIKKDPNADRIAKLEKDIEAYNKSIEAERSSMTKSMQDLDQAKRDQKLGRTSDDAVQKIEKRLEDSKEDIAELKKKESDAKKALDKLQPKESFKYVGESVSQKFSRLMKNV
jgi:DNA repair exonuclease SbcCD ATPase subunit